MINAVTVTNHLGETIKIDLKSPEKSGFAVKSIEGIGPAKAAINFTELATSDGAVDNSARLRVRNIVFNFIFVGVPTIEDARLRTYKYFPIKKRVKVVVETDKRICETLGRVEFNEPSIFDKQEGCQISILCGDPYFYLSGPNAITNSVFNGTEPMFKFKFGNRSLTQKKIMFGVMTNLDERSVVYHGDAEVGITIKIHALGPVKGLTIYDVTTRGYMRINDTKLESLLTSGIKEGDDIIINTSIGKKTIILQRDGRQHNILNSLDFPIEWFTLKKGDNMYAYTASEGLSFLQFRIENLTAYEGV